ncbi:hypothetical protein OIU34_19195 [Pararhizobium sp. BT-229]|uniref:hypothetical protein n=1 Tax=Pararhizobium sp. BT-229 TaxID=2986923 RepID=UPI0021F7D70C|nr:hypothetical protein [Pararhizobium sp. BT-229]MCV9964009.1 hypothetical protein [Pararhizobium sp. BT-229]
MKAQLKRKIDDSVVSDRATVLTRGAEIVCPELSKARIVLERVREAEGLLVLRMASQPVRPKSVPAHFLLLAIVEAGDGLWVETDPVMTFPGRKNAMLRDQPTVALEGKD